MQNFGIGLIIWDIEVGSYPKIKILKRDISHKAMHVNLDACINCNLCVRACREVQVNDVIGMSYRGHKSKITFDFDDQNGRFILCCMRRMCSGLSYRSS